MNQFSERYKTFLTSDLLKIIKNKSDYQIEAVEAAQNEIIHRQLTDEELTEAKNLLESERQDKIRQKEKRIEIENKIKNFSSSIIDTINPIQESAPSTERIIRLITIVFGFITIYHWYNQFELAQLMLFSDNTNWGFIDIHFFAPLLLLPMATTLFGFRKKIGWILLTIFLTYSIINVIGLIVLTINRSPIGISSIDNLFSETAGIVHLLTITFFIGTLWVINKKEIKHQFKISSNTVIGTISITVISTILIIAPYF